MALTTAKAVGAEFRFIDLPAWHNAFEERTNRYSDADARHIAVTSRLCAEFGMDNNDVLWDHLVEVPGAEYHTLARYFDTLRGDARGGDSDAAREEYMAQWICAAKYFARGRPIVVVTGGFHRPALVSLTAERDDLAQWPAVPCPRRATASATTSSLIPTDASTRSRAISLVCPRRATTTTYGTTVPKRPASGSSRMSPAGCANVMSLSPPRI